MAVKAVKKCSAKCSRLFCGGSNAGGPLVEVIEPRLLLSAVLHAASNSVIHPVADPLYINIHRNLGTKKPAANFAGSSTPLGLTPAQIRGAYGISSISFDGITGDGTGQTIAIVDAYDDPNAASDLNAFSTAFGLPTFNAGGTSPTFTKLGVNNSTDTTQTKLPRTDSEGPYSSTGGGDWEQEESLDIEWAHAIAPMANITLLEASNSSNDLYNAVIAARKLAGVDAVSMSWSGAETAGETSDDADFTTPSGHIGITFLAASGDDGSYSAGTTTNSPQYPAASPNVVAVGGTALTVNNDSYSSEIGWGSGTTSALSSSSTNGGSGGGISQYESQPSYQKDVVPTSITTTQRTYPDVSMNADPYTGVPIYDSWDFGTSTPWVPGYEGGTSLATPMWAGLIAIANQGRNLAGQTSLDGATQTLPALYKLPSTDFHDITSGSNGSYSAAPGYDLVTGIGTPVANTLVPDLAGLTQPSINNIYLKQDSDGTQLDDWINSATPGSGTPTQKFPLAEITAIQFNGATGNDTLTLDESAGTIASGTDATITYNASATGSNAINFVGTSASDGLTLTATGITPSGGFGTTPITLNNVQTVQFPGGSGGSDSINVSGSPVGGYTINADTPTGTPNIAVTISGTSTAVNFATTQHLASLTVGTTDTATLAQSASPGGNVLVVSSLAINGTGILNLTNNVMIVHDSGLSAITALLATGYNGGNWNGDGINSSAAANDSSKITALGVLLNSYNGSPYYTTFDGQPVATTDVLVKFTYYGDANLDGTVNGSDYSITDNGYNAQLSGWQNGDFNYDGSINGSDYELLDNTFNNPMPPL
jgi:hypothetical protein